MTSQSSARSILIADALFATIAIIGFFGGGAFFTDLYQSPETPTIKDFRFSWFGFKLQVFGTALLILALLVRYYPGRMANRITDIINAIGPARSFLDTLWTVNRWLSHPWRVSLALLPVIGFVTVLAVAIGRQIPWMSSDSVGFIGFEIWRNPAYGLLFRGLAGALSNVQAIVILQFVASIVAVLVLAEAVQKLFKNALMALFTGFSLAVSWPYLINSFFVLSDQLFLVCVTLHVAAILLLSEKVTPGRLLLASASAGVAILLRPAGLFFVVLIPFLIMLPNLSYRKFVLLVVGPVLGLILLTCTLNYVVHDRWMVSALGGASTSLNTVLLAQPGEGVSADSGFISKLAEVGQPHRHNIRNAGGLMEQTDYLRWNAMSIITRAIHETMKEIEAGQYETEACSYYSAKTLAFFARYSKFNEKLNDVSVRKANSVIWTSEVCNWWTVNALLERAYFQTIIDHPWQWVEMTASKVLAGWIEVVPFFSMSRNLAANRYIGVQQDGNIVLNVQPDNWWKEGLKFRLIQVYDLFGGSVFGLSLIISFPVIILFVGVKAVWKVLRDGCRREQLNAKSLAISYLFLMLCSYHLLLSISQIHFPRLLSAGLPVSLTLVSLFIYGLSKRETSCIGEAT